MTLDIFDFGSSCLVLPYHIYHTCKFVVGKQMWQLFSVLFFYAMVKDKLSLTLAENSRVNHCHLS